MRIASVGHSALRAATAAFAVIGMLVPAAAAADVPAPSTVRTATAHSATLTVSTGQNGVLTPGADLTAEILISNSGSDTLAAGTVSLALTSAPFRTRDALADWAAGSGDQPATREIGSAATPSLNPSSSASVPVTVPAASVGIGLGTTAVYGVRVTLSSGSSSAGSGYGSLVWNVGTGSTPSSVAVAMPLTAPVTSDGLISSANLAAYTADNGVLTRELNAAAEHPTVAIGVDPMILASIRVLGTAAPPSARQWLGTLASLQNDVFPLQYGDADLAGQVQAGITSFLQPTSFTYAMDPANVKGAPTIGETPTPTPTPTASPLSPTPTATAGTALPTLQQLLSWRYTLSGVAWPPENSVTGADLASFAKAGLTTTILDGGNTNASSLKTTPNAALAVSGGHVLVADHAISNALQAAIGASTDQGWSAAMARLNSELAMVAGEGSAHTLLATLGRSGSASPRMSETLSAIDSSPWSDSTSLRNAVEATATPSLEIKDTPETSSRIASIRGLIERESGPVSDQSIAGFSTALTDPTALTGPERNRLLSLLGAGWLDSGNDWAGAVSSSLSASASILDSVQIIPPGNVSQLSNEVLIPITVSNKFRLPVNVVLHATPSNGRLEIDSDTSKTVPAGATAKLLVPVKAKVGNGKVQLTMELFSPAGVKIGQTEQATVEVHAEWEGVGALIIAIVAVLLLGGGIVRTILRRRRERSEADAGHADAGHADAAETPAPQAPDSEPTDAARTDTPDG